MSVPDNLELVLWLIQVFCVNFRNFGAGALRQTKIFLQFPEILDKRALLCQTFCLLLSGGREIQDQ